MKKILFIILLLLAAAEVNAQFYPAKVYTTMDGLPSNAIFDAVQADNGEMWFVTSNGITVYDAHNWTVFPDSLGLPHDNTTRIIKAADGSIWLMGLNLSQPVLCSYKKEEWTCENLQENWNQFSSYLFEVAVVGDDYAILASWRNQVFYRPNMAADWKEYTLASIRPEDGFNSVQYIDSVFFLNSRKGQFEFDGKELSKSRYHNLLPGNKHTLLMQPWKNRMYVLGFNWLGYVENGSWNLITEDVGLDIPSFFNRHSLVVDNRGRIFYHSLSPVRMVDNITGKTSIMVIEGRQQNILSNRILLDRENNIWSVDNRGLFKFNLLKFQNYNRDSGLADDEVTAIFEASDGRVFVANNNHINVFSDGEIVQKLELPAERDIVNVRILDIAESTRGDILIASNQAGIFELGDNYLSAFRFNEPLTRVTSVEQFRGEEYITDGFTVYKIRNRSIEGVYSGNSKLIRNLINLDDQYLAVLTSDVGVHLYSEGEVKSYTSDYPAYNNTYHIRRWRGQFYIATAGGLAVLDGDKIKPFRRDLPFIETSFSLLVDHNNHLWVGTFNGVYHFDGSSSRFYRRGQGLVGNEINRNAFIEDRQNKIWIGTELGLSIYNEMEDLSNESSPELSFESIQLSDGQEILGLEQPVLPNQFNSISFDYRGISFQDDDIITYRYKLSGLADEWRYASNTGNSRVTYDALRSGAYTFILQAKNENSDWGQPLLYRFTIDRPLIGKWWFILLLVIALLMVFLVGFRIRYYFIMRKQKFLQQKVAEATEEIEKKNTSLQKTINELEQTQLQLVQSEKMAALGIMTAGVAHEINNPVNFIHAGAELIKSLTVEEEDRIVVEDKTMYKELMGSIEVGVDRILTIIRSLNAFSRSQAKMDDQVNLHKVLEDCLTILRYEYKNRIEVKRTYDREKELMVEGNESKLYQVFTNLLANAIQAIEGKGELRINTRKYRDNVHVTITDTGNGIPEEHLNKIFDPFFTTKDPGKGTGLGLSIVFNIIEEHKGEIQYQSEVGQGTSVKVKLKAFNT
jgi:signal transduction histidine kinase/ligand-binding sensor domain-containing protein